MGSESRGSVVRVFGSVAGSGQIALYDDMEGVVKWVRYRGLTLALLRKSGAAAYGGSYGLAVQQRRAIPNGNARGWACRSFGLRGEGGYEFRAAWRYNGASDVPLAELFLEFVAEEWSWKCGFIMEESTGAWGILVSSGLMLNGDYGLPGMDADCWHLAELVFAPGTGEYSSASMDGFALPCAGVSGPGAAAVGERDVGYVVAYVESDGVVKGIDLDDVFIRRV